MSDPVATLPELSVLIERLNEPSWIKYYSNYNCYTGPSDSMDYLINFYKNLRKSS